MANITGWRIAVASSVCLLALALSSPAAEPSFTDITAESGIGKIVQDKTASTRNWWMSGIDLVDIDGDGNMDLFMSGHGSDGIAALGDGQGHFKIAARTWPTHEFLMVYDVNEDGKLDTTMTFTDGGGQWFLNRSQPGKLHFEATKEMRGVNSSRDQAMQDFDRDGKVDWLRNPEGVGLVLDAGDGKGGFVEKGKIGGELGSFGFPVDLNGDGFIDFVLMTAGGYADHDGKSGVYLNDGKNNFVKVVDPGFEEVGNAIKGVGDFNQDGYPDLAMLERCTHLELYLNDGKGKFTKKEGALKCPPFELPYGSWGIAVMTDFDNDGIPDLIVNGKKMLKVYRGNGDGTLTYMNDVWKIKDTATAAVDEGLCFGDFNNDGKLDLVGYDEIWPNRSLKVYRNDLPAQNWVRIRPVGLAGNRGAAGTKICVFEAGTKKLLWYEQVAIFSHQTVLSYYASTPTERHFGLGTRATVDVSVEFYPSRKVVEKKGVNANHIVTVNEENSQVEETLLKAAKAEGK